MSTHDTPRDPRVDTPRDPRVDTHSDTSGDPLVEDGRYGDRPDWDRAPGTAPAPTEAELARREQRAAHSDDTDAIRADIDRTRSEMVGTINAVEDKVSPSRIVERRRSRLRERMRAARESVMGGREQPATSYSGSPDWSIGTSDDSSSAMDGVSDAAGTARDRVQAAPERAKARTRGNPLAAGMVAFGLGAIIGSALPSSDAEQRLAERGARNLDTDRLREEGRQLAQDVREPVEQEARRAADEVRSTAKGEAEDMRDEAGTSAERVRGDAERARDEVREQA